MFLVYVSIIIQRFRSQNIPLAAVISLIKKMLRITNNLKVPFVSTIYIYLIMR